MRTPQPLPPEIGSTPFTCREALDAGASQRRLRHSALLAPSRGIRVPAMLPDPGLAPMVRPLTPDEITSLEGLLCDSRLRGPAGLPEPLLNVATELCNGVVRAPDLSYPEYKVAAEYDGDGHSATDQVVRDISREEDFSRAGWTLVRLSKRHMAADARSAVAKIRAALLHRGWCLPQ
jgi:hypothetical protein